MRGLGLYLARMGKVVELGVPFWAHNCCFGLDLTQYAGRVWRRLENAQEPEPYLTDENLDTPQLRQLGGDLMDHLLELAYPNFS